METTLNMTTTQVENTSESGFNPASGIQNATPLTALACQTNKVESFQNSPLWIGHILAQFLDGRQTTGENSAKLPFNL